MFCKLFGSPHRRPVARLLRKLMLEALEDRLTPAGYSLTDLSPLHFLAAESLNADAMNNSGQVVGASPASGGGQNAVLYSNGQLTNLGTLSSENYSSALGINNSGQIVGFSSASNGNDAFLFSNGQMTDLNSLATSGSPGQLSTAVAINDSGQIAGNGFPTGGSLSQAFLYSNGTVTYLGSLNTVGSSTATDINASGQVVGYSLVAGSSTIDHAFLYSNGQMTDLGTLVGNTGSSDAYGINASGQIVGVSQAARGVVHAFLYSNGTMTDLGVPTGFSATEALDINDSGQVVGGAEQGSTFHAFLYSNGTWTDLNSLLPAGTTVTLTEAISINDNGQIVAEGSDGNLYLLTPQQSTGTIISNGTVSPNALTASNSGQQVTVSATVNTNGAPATVGNVVFSLVGANGTVVSDGPTGVGIGSNGQASDTLTVPGGTAAGSYSLSVAYTNNGQTTTQAFTGALTINPASSAPVITANPSNESVTVGQTATFTASASGNPTPSVQWQVSYDGGKSFTNLNGAKLTMLTLNNVPTAANGDEFRAVFTNSAGSETTSAATLTVAAAPPSPSSPSQPAPTPAPSSPSIPDQMQQLVQDVVLMGQSLSSGDIGSFGQALQNYESLLVTVESEIFQIVLNDLAQLLNS